MADMMTFPNTVEEFMEQYKIVDTEQIYTNGVEMVPIFRMNQWFEHEPERKKGKWLTDGEFPKCSECGKWIDVFQGDAEMNYCPDCGADMRGDRDETN